jgi:hypothetical protein
VSSVLAGHDESAHEDGKGGDDQPAVPEAARTTRHAYAVAVHAGRPASAGTRHRRKQSICTPTPRPQHGPIRVVRTTELSVHAYPLAARVAAALLVAASAASLPAIGLLVWLSADPPILPPVLFRLFAVLTIAPAAGAALIDRLCRAEAKMDDGLVLERPGLHVTVPASAIARIVPWILPLPGPGLSFRLRSGRRLAWSIAAADPLPLLAGLAERGVEAAHAAAAHPAVAYAHARATLMRRRWYHLAAKYPVFALAPAAVLFTTHQWIAYGGSLGQYYLEGLGPYLRTFIVHWVTVVIYLACYASVWRDLAEASCLALTWVAPQQASHVRRVAEAGCRLAYFAGVPAFLASRYLA